MLHRHPTLTRILLGLDLLLMTFRHSPSTAITNYPCAVLQHFSSGTRSRSLQRVRFSPMHTSRYSGSVWGFILMLDRLFIDRNIEHGASRLRIGNSSAKRDWQSTSFGGHISPGCYRLADSFEDILLHWIYTAVNYALIRLIR
jgi:hypothetical protein